MFLNHETEGMMGVWNGHYGWVLESYCLILLETTKSQVN